jgi:hypothetical protein
VDATCGWDIVTRLYERSGKCRWLEAVNWIGAYGHEPTFGGRQDQSADYNTLLVQSSEIKGVFNAVRVKMMVAKSREVPHAWDSRIDTA